MAKMAIYVLQILIYMPDIFAFTFNNFMSKTVAEISIKNSVLSKVFEGNIGWQYTNENNFNSKISDAKD